MKLVSFIAACTIALSGCASQTFVITGADSKAPTKEEAQTFWISGIGQENVLDAAKVCGGADKVLKVESRLGPLNIILGAVTFGIYTPRDAKVYCR